MKILPQGPLCFDVKEDSLFKNDRMDVFFFHPKYIEIEKQLVRIKYPLTHLEDISESIVNFGAYSLCNNIEFVDKGIPFLNVSDIREEGINLEEVKQSVTDKTHKLLWKSQVEPGTVLLTMAGTIGIASVMPETTRQVNSNQAIAKIILNRDINPQYVADFLNTRFGRCQTERESTGGVQKNINLGQIKSLRIPIPPAKIQSKVVNIMKKARDMQKQNSIRIETLKKGALVFLKQELGLKSQESRDDNIFLTEIGDRFDVDYYKPRYVRNLKILRTGKFALRSLQEISLELFRGIEPGSNNYTEEGEILFLRVQNLKKGHVEIGDNSVFLKEDFYKKNVQFQPKYNDVLFSKDGTIGLSATYDNFPRKCLIASGIAIIKLKKDIDPVYLSYFLNSEFIELQSMRESYGSIIQHLSMGSLNNLLVPVPDYSIQNKISKKILETEQKINELKIESEKVVKEAKETIEKTLIDG